MTRERIAGQLISLALVALPAGVGVVAGLGAALIALGVLALALGLLFGFSTGPEPLEVLQAEVAGPGREAELEERAPVAIVRSPFPHPAGNVTNG